MTLPKVWRGERGMAIIVTLLVLLSVTVLLGAATLVGSGATLIGTYHDRLTTLESVADAGLEEARSRINGDTTAYPETGYTVLEDHAQVYTAGGTVIPGIQRSVYVGPSGLTSGQYGVFGSIVSVVEDARGNRVVRRAEVFQESFAKFAYFTDIEGMIYFGGGDQIFGPAHSNDIMKIHSTGATFHGAVTTAQTIQDPQYGTFKQGYQEHVAYIPMPKTADLTKLQIQGQAGLTAIVSTTAGADGQASTRIEFVAVDLNGDGLLNGSNEGFIKVYQALAPANAWWVVADTFQYGGSGGQGLRSSFNCGHVRTGYHDNEFQTFARHGDLGSDARTPATTTGTRRCFLGGSDILNPDTAFMAVDSLGRWLPWPGTVSGLVAATGRPDAAYLWPITRALNPSFKGVIYVEGRVAISGRLRGQVTVAATDDIIVADDMTYVTNPAAGTCQDVMGLFSGDDILVADNTLNDPFRPYGTQAYTTWDDTKDEFVHAVVLALDKFGAVRYNSGPNNAQSCEATSWGRGCLYLTGGIIQKARGAVGTIGGTGYLKRYSYDQCAYTNPPPYFPTTGHFARGHYYEVDPTGFDVTAYWAQLTSH